MLSDLFNAVILVCWLVALVGLIAAAVRRPSHFVPRFVVLLTYVAFVGLLIVAALALDPPTAVGFALFLLASAAFFYGFLRLAPWDCWTCSTVNPPRAAVCTGCGITHAESDEIEAQEIDRY